ncbi:MAG: LysM peptidoglycan-binding domain-containing protein [Anaerolineae bacterium]|nr:LysM peptidoglycan-binding domain-containing protein [Anaerolineae bacterium]
MRKVFCCLICIWILTLACNIPRQSISSTFAPQASATPVPVRTVSSGYESRPAYSPGELVEYIVQTGDTLPALAAHFNTREAEIRSANPALPASLTTLPPGMPLKIPIYYEALWGNPYQILPDSLFINGPAQRNFDTVAFVDSQPGWLKTYRDIVGGTEKRGGELIDQVALNFSISPRVLLAIVQYQTGALTNPINPNPDDPFPLGYPQKTHQRLYQQLVLTANTLNNGYYGWRSGTLTEFEHLDGRLEVPDPWQNAATVALQYHFSNVLNKEDYAKAISPDGFASTYANLFGDAWQNAEPHLPGSLEQPPLVLPFLPGKRWALTGGPHTGWGKGEPFAALDFAPPSEYSGCAPSKEMVTSVGEGIVARSGNAVLVVDMDFDSDERTGWNIFYLHLSGPIPRIGKMLKTRDPVGFPSCEGGSTTGTHVHIARKYNGEWILAGGPLAFNLEGWIAKNGDEAYEGELQRFGNIVRASTLSESFSQIESTAP